MKMRLFTVTVLATISLAYGIGSCNNAATEVSNTSGETAIVDLEQEPESTDAFDYQANWELFKTTIREKDEEGLAKQSTENIKDYESLLYMLSEMFVMKKMDETAFEDLETVELEGQSYLKFYAEDIGIDEFGYEYGSAVTLYFIQQEDGLYLDKYSAAG